MYPRRKPPNFHEATFLANYFDTIELNVSFYRPVPAHTAAEWVERVSQNPDFVFTAKFWQEFTHTRDLSADSGTSIFILTKNWSRGSNGFGFWKEMRQPFTRF